MKTNYIPTDEVKIINPDNFAYGFDGDVLSNNPDASKPLTVILRGGAGSWSFKYNEVSPMGLKTSDTPNGDITHEHIKAISKRGLESVATSLENEGKQKRKYTRRDKTEVKVTKRKYTKKAK